MLYVDQKFLQLLSPRLRNFKRVGRSVYQFSCPFCGDSKRDRRKARGYAYERAGSLLVYCHRCGKSTNTYGLLRHMDEAMLRDYQVERFEAEMVGRPAQFTPEEFTGDQEVVDSHVREIGLPSAEFLPPGHVARETLARRRIPEHRWKDYYHAEDFASWANTLVPQPLGGGRYSTPGDARLVIPIWSREGTLVGFQGRAYGNARSKYLTAAVDKGPPFLYGWDRVATSEGAVAHGTPLTGGAGGEDIRPAVEVQGEPCQVGEEGPSGPLRRIVAVEGPIDSEFVPSGVASAGGAITRELLKTGLPRGRFVVAYDNEPRSQVTVDKVQKAIAADFPVFIWPHDVVEKDFNDLVMKMMDQGAPLELALSRIEQMIDSRTFSGMEAELELVFWKKV